MAQPVAHLNVQNNEDGTVSLNAVYIGGYDPKNHAHQLVRIALAHLDSILVRLAEPHEQVGRDGEVEPVPVESVPMQAQELGPSTEETIFHPMGVDLAQPGADKTVVHPVEGHA